ncbi:MAG: shikimate dehydrogenase [Armatimonadetes bacterium]|nr:shikimate dehydrogenase [Armatimonadota bacterium]
MPDIWGTTRLVGVIGWPVRHSFSPPMQNAALAAMGLDWAYVPFAVAPDDLPAALAGLRAAGLVGFNATIPHKQALLGLVDHPTAEAQLTGTVNTVHFTPDGIVGDSTDGPGFVAALAADGCQVAGRRVVVLGAGGSARAVSVSLVRAGAERLVVANRTAARADELCELLNERVRAGSAEAMALDSSRLETTLAAADLIVNTTSVGMYPEMDAAPVTLPALAAGAWLVDIIYNPAETQLMRAAAERGASCRNGVSMLAYQGALALARWTGQEPPAELMRSVLSAELARRSA